MPNPAAAGFGGPRTYLPTDDMSIASLMDEMLGLRSAVVSGATDVLQRFPADVRADA
eukprot:gene25295-27389_t